MRGMGHWQLAWNVELDRDLGTRLRQLYVRSGSPMQRSELNTTGWRELVRLLLRMICHHALVAFRSFKSHIGRTCIASGRVQRAFSRPSRRPACWQRRLAFTPSRSPNQFAEAVDRFWNTPRAIADRLVRTGPDPQALRCCIIALALHSDGSFHASTIVS